MIYTPVSMDEARTLMERILVEVEGESANVAELALVMSYLEVMGSLRPLPKADASLRVKYFLAVGMEVMAKVAVAAYDKTPKELMKWDADHAKTINAMRDTNGRKM